MKVVNFSDTRANLKDIMDGVVQDSAPVVVSRKNGESVVIVSLADWNATEETVHLLSQPANAARLKAAIEALDAGKGTERALDA